MFAAKRSTAVSSFCSGITAPAPADLEAVSRGRRRDLPPHYRTSPAQLIALGTYPEGGPATLTLSGEVNGEPREFTYPVTFTKDGGSDFLPRLWATRKIGYLLNQIRLHGENEELVDAVIDLSLEHGIVTPYTSYLITEDDIHSQEARDQAAEAASRQIAAAPASGAGAVTQAQEVQAMADVDTGPLPVATRHRRG
jgi:Ca-activated chloride channel family protein